MAGISRRRFVGAGLAALAARPGLGGVSRRVELPQASDLDGHALVQRLELAGIAKVERLGASRNGRPIDLISVGRGPRAALIVGAPHANEPIGCTTIVRMLAHLKEDRALREGSGWRWHFIPAVDVDGIAFNESWFRGELSLEHYLRGFYRPPFRLQPEYAFPLNIPGYRFEQQTPESTCWRIALDHVRPRLQCSLHGADTGGSFFLATGCLPGLCADLGELPIRYDITLNTVGEASLESVQLAPGVFSLPSIDALIAKALAAKQPPNDVWDAGDSSAGYSAKCFGTFNMVCEVPLWLDARERSSRSSGRTLSEVLDEEIGMVRADQALLAHYAGHLNGGSDNEAAALWASVVDAVQQSDGAIEELTELKASGNARRVLAFRDLVQYEYGTASFRTLAMAVRLAGRVGASDLQSAAGDALRSRVDRYQNSAHLTPVSLRSSTDLQMRAIIATARRLGES